MQIPKVLNLVARVLEFLWTLLIMALVGNMISEAYGGNPSIVNYAIFVSVFSMLSLFYLIPATFKESFMIHPLIMVVLDVVNVLFFFCGAVALAAELHVHSCSNEDYVTSNSVTNGSYNPGKRCREAQATCAFLWFGFLAYAISAVLSGIQGAGSANLRGGNRKSGPSMSQV